MDIFQIQEKSIGENENLIMSPFSILVSMAMILNGASSETEEEIRKCLFEGRVTEDINAFFENSIQHIQNSVLLSNSVWLRTSIQPQPNFIQMVQKIFHGTFCPLKGAKEINEWISENTKGKITHVFDQIDPSELMVLVSAIYFKGFFNEKFDKTLTKSGDFITIDGNKQNCMIMTNPQTERMYLENDRVQSIILDYVSDFSCMILLPKKGYSIAELLKTVKEIGLKELVHLHGLRKGHFSMPKFSIRSKSNLLKTFQQLGLKKAFINGPDFSHITGGVDRNLCISSIVHEAVIQFDEEGTEAAAITATRLKKLSLLNSEPFDMRVDHPFIFLIYSKETFNELFFGKITNILS